MTIKWPTEPTTWPAVKNFPTGKPLGCEASAIMIALDARALLETYLKLSKDKRATEFQLDHYRNGAASRIDNFVDYMGHATASQLRA